MANSAFRKDGQDGPPPAVLAYTEFTTTVQPTGTDTGSADVVVTAPAVTFSGTQRVKITFFSPVIEVDPSVGNPVPSTIVYLFQDASALLQFCTVALDTAAGSPNQMHIGGVTCIRIFTPTAGSKIYSVRAIVETAGDTAFIKAGEGTSGERTPGFILIEECP